MAIMPTKLYGPHDNFDLENTHVLQALIRGFHEVRMAGKKEVVIWGTGTPKREFFHADDMADACVFVMNLNEKSAIDSFSSYPIPCFANQGTGIDCTIH